MYGFALLTKTICVAWLVPRLSLYMYVAWRLRVDRCCWQTNAKLKSAEEERDVFKQRLDIERDSRKELEGDVAACV